MTPRNPLQQSQQINAPLTGKDFYDMSGPDLLAYCGEDASKWAEAFCKIKEVQGWGATDIDEGLMVGWFANAIEYSWHVRTHAAPASGDVRAAAIEECIRAAAGVMQMDPAQAGGPLFDALRALSQAPATDATQYLRYHARFLLDRLQEFDPGDFEAERDFHGHVAPAIARLRNALGVA
jgi:hypothetical protein